MDNGSQKSAFVCSLDNAYREERILLVREIQAFECNAGEVIEAATSCGQVSELDILRFSRWCDLDRGEAGCRLESLARARAYLRVVTTTDFQLAGMQGRVVPFIGR